MFLSSARVGVIFNNTYAQVRSFIGKPGIKTLNRDEELLAALKYDHA